MENSVLTICDFRELPLWAKLTLMLERNQKNPHRHRELISTQKVVMELGIEAMPFLPC